MLMNITPANVLLWVSIIVNIFAIVVSIIKSDSVSTILLSLGQSALNLYLTMFFIDAITTITEWKPINHNKSLTLNDLKSFRKDVELN